MNRGDEHRAMMLRAMRLGFAEGWAARGRAIGDRSAPQFWASAFSRRAANLMRRKGVSFHTSSPAPAATRPD